jgi:HD-like signal output (HDOD) protein
LAEKTAELAEIMKTLDSLQSRVEELTTDEAPSPPMDPVSRQKAPRALASDPEPVRVVSPAVKPSIRGPLATDDISLLRNGFAELASYSKHKAFPEFFARLSESTGLRMLLLKRWTSGLQVFMEKNIKMPAEAKKKRSDGRAPIPSKKSDLFEVTGEEATVYCGPVPVQHFPLDLTLMLGRGSRDRQIIILPLPSQNHWNTFLYLDADQSTEKSLLVAELLAHFALARMCLLNKGIRNPQGRVARIKQSELQRRRLGNSKKNVKGGPVDNDAAAGESRRKLAELDVDPFVVSSDGSIEDNDGAGVEPDQIPLAPQPIRQESTPASPPSEVTAEAPVPVESDPFVRTEEAAVENADQVVAEDDLAQLERPLPGKHDGLTPELILSHSGELPALPKAACHIMAVIEDPRTTATRLEKALAMDQALTAKVLRIANSPFYGAVREIRTVSEAIVRLGFVTIRNWTLVTAARSVFLAPGAGMMYKNIWSQSVLSAMAGQLVAQVLGRVDAEAVFIGGLMQNIGQLVLARSQPVLFQEILVESETSCRPYHEVERKMLGFDHGELGAILIKEWNLSQDLEEAVRWHHDFKNPDAKNTQYAAMIALGEEIAWESLEEVQDAKALADQSDQNDPAADPAEPKLSSAAILLGITGAQLAALKEDAAKLKIDPHFFN